MPVKFTLRALTEKRPVEMFSVVVPSFTSAIEALTTVQSELEKQKAKITLEWVE